MTDYASCPHCKGSGLIPLADAECEDAHRGADYRAEQEAQREREQQVHAANLTVRLDDAERRYEAMQRAVYGGLRGAWSVRCGHSGRTRPRWPSTARISIPPG
jgi:hypothetical protein